MLFNWDSIALLEHNQSGNTNILAPEILLIYSYQLLCRLLSWKHASAQTKKVKSLREYVLRLRSKF